MAMKKCYICNNDTNVKKGLFGGLVEVKFEICDSCNQKVNTIVDTLPDMDSMNKISGLSNLTSPKKYNANIKWRCGVELAKRLIGHEKKIDSCYINNGPSSQNKGMMLFTDSKFALFTFTTMGVSGVKGIGCQAEYSTPLENIITISTERGLKGNKIVISDKGGGYKGEKIYCQTIQECENFISKLLTHKEGKSNPNLQVNSSKNSESDNLDKLKKLKELLDMGVITDEEFNQKKTDLLNNL